MSMTRSRASIDQERWRSEQRAIEARRAAQQARFPTVLRIKAEIDRYRRGGVVPWVVLLGPDEYARWRREFADEMGLDDYFQGVALVRVNDPGIDPLAEPWEE